MLGPETTMPREEKPIEDRIFVRWDDLATELGLEYLREEDGRNIYKINASNQEQLSILVLRSVKYIINSKLEGSVLYDDNDQTGHTVILSVGEITGD